jgi:hypothetical protein
MEEKELIRRIKNSLKAKKPRAKILKNMQERGYKLEYADALMKKAQRPRMMLISILIAAVLFFSISIATYTIFSTNQKAELKNPLTGFAISQEIQQQTNTPSTQHQTTTSQKNVSIEEIEITPEFITFILNEIGAWQLHKNPLTFEKPSLNFNVDGEKFNSIIDNGIVTTRGTHNGADIEFLTSKKEVIDVITSQNPKKVVKEFVNSEKIKISILASQSQLFAKGYKNFYDSIN